MANKFSRGHNFSDGPPNDDVIAAYLHALIEEAAPTTAFVDDQPEKSLVTGDYALVKDTVGNRLARVKTDALMGQGRQYVLAGTAADAALPSAIVIPMMQYAGNAVLPAPVHAVSDHFEGSTLNPKWAIQGSATNQSLIVANSCVKISGSGPAGSSTAYWISQPLVQGASFSIKIGFTCICLVPKSADTWAYVLFQIFRSGVGYARMDLGFDFRPAATSPTTAGYNTPDLKVLGGPAAGSTFGRYAFSSFPVAVQIDYNIGSRDTFLALSPDGVNIYSFLGLVGTSTGFVNGHPDAFGMGIWVNNTGLAVLIADYVKFTPL
jgi:hypothetical protein